MVFSGAFDGCRWLFDGLLWVVDASFSWFVVGFCFFLCLFDGF